MTGSGAILEAGPYRLRRASSGDHDQLVDLQRKAYARNRELLGLEPLPLLVDYREVLARNEVWVLDGAAGFNGALVLELRADDLLIESIATDPASQGQGIGRAMLEAALERGRALGYKTVRLYTGSTLTHLIAWYGRHGFEIERTEALSDRSITHMVKSIAGVQA